MGAAKNIFGAFSNVLDRVKSVVKPVSKSLDSSVIKTTSKVSGSAAPAVVGGTIKTASAASKFAKGVGSTANVGGKVFGVTGIIGGVSLASAKIYDYVGDQFAITTTQREYENQIKLAGQEADVTKQAQDQQIAYMLEVARLRALGQDPNVMGASGGSGFGDNLFPLGAAAEEKVGNNAILYALIGVAIIASGTYIYTKKKVK